MRLAEIVAFYETLTPSSVSRLADLYAPDAHFQDPFNDVRGVPAIEAVFRHMFVQTLEPRFVVDERFVGEGTAVLAWRFHFRMRRWRAQQLQTIHGLTHLRFDADGRVTDHRDHWDSAKELYMKLPLLGSLMRTLRCLLAAAQPQRASDVA